MDSESSDILYHTPTNVIIVPTSSHNHVDGGGCREHRCRGCGSPMRRSSPSKNAAYSSGRYDPANYLTRGGNRAVDKANEEKLVRLNKAAMKDLQLANNTLAQELVKLQSSGSEERQALREEVVKLELLLQAQNDKIELLQSRLDDEKKKNEDAEEKHHARLKEVARRLKAEHMSKLKPLQEAHSGLLEELAVLQDGNTQLVQTREQLKDVTARLEMESESRSELWQRCSAMEQELRAANEALDTSVRRLKSAELQLERYGQVEKRLQGAEQALQAERVAHSKLQADASLDSSQAAALRIEVDRLRREVAGLTKRAEAAEAERAALKLTLADAQAAAADAAVEVRTATARADRLQQELELTRQEADSQASSLRSQAAAREDRLAAQHASRVAELQSQVDARGAAAADAESALSTARAEITRLTSQVDSLRHMGNAADSQLAASEVRVEQLQERVTQLEQQLKAAQVSGLQKEAALSEALSHQKSSTAEWAEERQQLQEAAVKWRQKAVQLQEELEKRSEQAVAASQLHTNELSRAQVAMEAVEAELAQVKRQLAAVEDDRTAAAKRSSTLLAQWEERDKGQTGELAALRSKLSELLEAHDAARTEADTCRQQLRAKEHELESVTIQLADEHARVAALRAELGSVEHEKAAEVEARLRSMQELSTALAAEQQARLDAQVELHKTKKRQSTIEAQLQQQRIETLSQVLEAKTKAEEAANTSAALAAAERKAKQYKLDSTTMLSDYDAWVQDLLAKKGAGSSSTGTAAGRSLPVARKSAISPAPMSTQASLSRSNSQLASPGGLAIAAAGLKSPLQHQKSGGAAADLDKYDRIAALLEGRNSHSGSTGFARSASGKSISLAGSTAAVASPGRTSTLSASAKALSPRPSFR